MGAVNVLRSSGLLSVNVATPSDLLRRTRLIAKVCHFAPLCASANEPQRGSIEHVVIIILTGAINGVAVTVGFELALNWQLHAR